MRLRLMRVVRIEGLDSEIAAEIGQAEGHRPFVPEETYGFSVQTGHAVWVVYPDGVWYAGLGEPDAGGLVDHLLDGAPLDERRYEWPDD